MLSQLFQSTGVALFIGSIFTFVLSTEQFVAFIRERLINIVISKDFIANLNQQEQKKLLHMVLKPAKELSSIYSGITDYFNQYIDNSMRLFDTIYRGHMKIDGVVSYNNEKKCIQIAYDIDYIVYKTNDAFEPLVLGLEDESSEHIQTIIRGVGGLEEVLTDEHSKEQPLDDPTIEKMMALDIPEKFNKLSQISVSRRIVEYGSDHWQLFSYKNIKACDQLSITLSCSDDILIKTCNTYGVQGGFSIEKKDTRIKVTYSDWLSPGFGVNVLVAKKDYH